MFRSSLKRKLVSDSRYYVQLVQYIHCNAVRHGFAEVLGAWPHSSYLSYLAAKATHLRRAEVFNWFENETSFLDLHAVSNLSGLSDLTGLEK